MSTPGLSLDVLPQRYLPLAVSASEAGPSAGNRSAQPHVQQLVFFATHALTPLDVRLYRHYSRQLRYSQSRARLWVLLYQPAQDGVQSLPDASKEVEAGVCVWGDGTLRRALPALAARTAGASANTPDPNHRRYFWFHSSLLLWNRTFGHAYPNVRYLWRVEPDVLFAGSWTELVGLADRQQSVDLLLPHLTTHAAHPGVIPCDPNPGPQAGCPHPSAGSFDAHSAPHCGQYPHWGRNKHILRRIPREEWVYSLVSIGRFSRRFMELMARKWAAGIAGYEEILLPMSCTARDGCVRGSFHRMHSHGWRQTHVSDYFRYRPDWGCGTFLRSGAAHTQELWHPVKHRECWVEYLDSCTPQGCKRVPPPDP